MTLALLGGSFPKKKKRYFVTCKHTIYQLKQTDARKKSLKMQREIGNSIKFVFPSNGVAKLQLITALEYVGTEKFNVAFLNCLLEKFDDPRLKTFLTPVGDVQDEVTLKQIVDFLKSGGAGIELTVILSDICSFGKEVVKLKYGDIEIDVKH